MALLTGLTQDGLEVPIQVKPDGKMVAEGLTGPAGAAGATGAQGPAGPEGPMGRSIVQEGVRTLGAAQEVFSGIPNWTKKITVLLDGVSLAVPDGAYLRVQIGSAGGWNQGRYLSVSSYLLTRGLTDPLEGGSYGDGDGFTFVWGVNTSLRYGSIVLCKHGASNTWVATGQMNGTMPGASVGTCWVSGAVSATGPVDRLRLVSSDGVTSFDLGTASVLYEG